MHESGEHVNAQHTDQLTSNAVRYAIEMCNNRLKTSCYHSKGVGGTVQRSVHGTPNAYIFEYLLCSSTTNKWWNSLSVVFLLVWFPLLAAVTSPNLFTPLPPKSDTGMQEWYFQFLSPITVTCMRGACCISRGNGNGDSVTEHVIANRMCDFRIALKH